MPKLAALQGRLRALIEACAAARGQSLVAQPSGAPVTLIAASKRQPVEKLMALYDAGHRDFGENYVQELQHKAQAMHASGRHPRWHLIGPLQRNKVGAAAAWGATVHTIASLPVAHKLATCAERLGQRLTVLLQVFDPGGLMPQRRSGVPPPEACALARAVAALPQLHLVGLMVLPHPGGRPEEAFARLRALSHAVRREPGCQEACQLSMGMSHDFRAAILEGATMVRVGSALFGPRP